MITTPVSSLDARYDVVVLGSGAAGLVAAVRAADAGHRVLVAEKADLLGGTTAAGGGVMWCPANPLMAAAGFADSAERGRSYLAAAAGHAMSGEEISWYIDTAPLAVAYLDTHTHVAFRPLGRPDYHLEWNGAASGGRSLDNDPFDPAEYPGLAEAVRPSSYFPLLTMHERDRLNGGAPDPALLKRRRAAGVRTMGGALVASLVASALDRGVHFSVGTAAESLDPGPGCGWTLGLAHDGSTATIEARIGVVLATGGFEWNERLRKTFLTFPVTPISAPSNEGDGLLLGLKAGAAVADMTAIWGVPVITPPGQRYDGVQSGRMGNVEMTLPGSITVNAAGRRFVNEALNYHDACRVFASVDPHTLGQANNPAWLVFDSNYLRKYPVAGSTPGRAEPWMPSAPTIAGLAEQLGIDANRLTATVTRFNADAEAGVDAEFGRGSSKQDRHLGDAGNLPNPCLAPLLEAPFYAVPVHAGALGTSGGLATDFHGRVLDNRGCPIPGLFASGNVSAGVFRNNYPGGGATLGSAITRAFAAGEFLAVQAAPAETQAAMAGPAVFEAASGTGES